MNVSTMSRVTVTIDIEPGVWLVRNLNQGYEVSITRVEILFTDGNPYSMGPTTVRRNKTGEWGKASGGWVTVNFADAPAGIRREALTAFHQHLQAINATAEKHGKD